jgi:hypothetical protein
MGSLAPRATPNVENQGLHFIWPLALTCLSWVALPGAYAPASIPLWVIGARKPHLHDTGVVLEEAPICILTHTAIQSRTGPGTANNCAGEDQQQFTGPNSLLGAGATLVQLETGIWAGQRRNSPGGKEPPVPIGWEAELAPGQVWTLSRIYNTFSPIGNRTPILPSSRPWFSHYTDRATPSLPPIILLVLPHTEMTTE